MSASAKQGDHKKVTDSTKNRTSYTSLRAIKTTSYKLDEWPFSRWTVCPFILWGEWCKFCVDECHSWWESVHSIESHNFCIY